MPAVEDSVAAAADVPVLETGDVDRAALLFLAFLAEGGWDVDPLGDNGRFGDVGAMTSVPKNECEKCLSRRIHMH
jgi:hypothetical protein